ncbi:hypothetical protein CQW32_20355 [Pseudomonas putida]|uniref:Cap15 family cyclic dinucleotide receptor domain-containing protein n=1 Tax=Pseudomonas putida TaxID=303 RepID=UPI000C2A08E6|nr:hypothetical protein [Pseudomonas putida]MBF8160930.1 hypothetical protein [Pseudomonas mendocina]PJX08580.1 hypothetical protein CQW32_20355 [Pseudomonas putida]HBO3354279.1 hypothetical protein [Pseudomonas aeruginosa]HCF5435891.1 hypothetical protein [Pseudomonas aeruginosa]
MYQVLGIKALLKVFGLGCLLIFILILLGYAYFQPSALAGLGAYWRAASVSVSIVSAAIVICGETPVFPWACRRIPFIRGYFPPIEGLWKVTVKSNWGAIQRLMGNNDIEPLISKAGTIRITSRFFRVRLVFQSDDKYSSSHSVCVSVQRDPEHGTTQLNYIYHNKTLVPEATDASSHNGAARVNIQDDGDVVTLEGVYFTDRKWTEGLNTAGLIRFEGMTLRSAYHRLPEQCARHHHDKHQ